jgi:hypothetical protein
MPLTKRAILNPGSVGQPRDRDPRAAYAIFDPEANTWEARRVAYNFSRGTGAHPRGAFAGETRRPVGGGVVGPCPHPLPLRFYNGFSGKWGRYVGEGGCGTFQK